MSLAATLGYGAHDDNLSTSHRGMVSSQALYDFVQLLKRSYSDLVNLHGHGALKQQRRKEDEQDQARLDVCPCAKPSTLVSASPTGH